MSKKTIPMALLPYDLYTQTLVLTLFCFFCIQLLFPRNHFTRKSYYDEMFSDIPGWEEVRFMEKKMQDLGIQNCSYWGTYLYGRKQYGSPMVIHMDGRRETDTTHIS